jgi:tol-pal system protein YbgF
MKSYFNSWLLLSQAALPALMVFSCASPQQIDLIEREQRRLRAEATTVRGETSDIRVEFERVRASLADTRATLQEMQRDLSVLKGKMEESRYMAERQIGQSAREGEQKLGSLERRLAKIDEELNAQKTLLKNQEEELRGLRETRLGGAGEGKGAGSAQGGETSELASGKTTGELDPVKKDYEDALRLMDMKEYRLAVVRFRDFIKRNSTSELADNAQYWIGECHYALKEFDQAILEFDQVRRKYPKADKVPAALLKQGFAFAELGDKLDARLILQELIDRYPLSHEAARAKEKLKSLQS